MFNEKIKLEFLDFYKKGTYSNYENVLKKFDYSQQVFKKDIYEFTDEEFDMALRVNKYISLQSIATDVSIVKQYIEWWHKEKMYKSKINFNNFSGSKLKRYVSNNANKYFLSEEEFDDVLCRIQNWQDIAIYVLLFEGVKGTNGEELINLKISDCNFDKNIFTLTRNDGSKRNIKILSNDRRDALMYANSEEIYIRKNGSFPYGAVNLNNTEYIIKASGTQNTGKVKYELIRYRIRKIYDELKKESLKNMTNVWTSGMICYGKRLKVQKGGELDKDDYMMINDKFGIELKYWYKTKRKILDYI